MRQFHSAVFRGEPQPVHYRQWTPSPVDRESWADNLPYLRNGKFLLVTHKKLHTGYLWYQNLLHWITLNSTMAVISCYFTEFGTTEG